jgi:hypothetical protein
MILRNLSSLVSSVGKQENVLALLFFYHPLPFHTCSVLFVLDTIWTLPNSS